MYKSILEISWSSSDVAFYAFLRLKLVKKSRS
jgi:hypothetical protein